MNPFELIVFAGLFGAAALFHLYEARAWREERSQLLNRLMSRSWGEYVAGVRDDIDRPQLVTDELEARWADDHEMSEAS